MFRIAPRSLHVIYRSLPQRWRSKLRCDASDSTMVRIEEVQDEAEKVRQQGLDLAEENEDDEWEATDAESDDVCVVFDSNS